MEAIRKKLLKYDLIYGDFIKFCQTDYHRDFEVLTHTVFNTQKLRILIKGVVKVEYSPKAQGSGYTLDDKYINSEFRGEGTVFQWGVRSFELSNWILEDSTEDILELQPNYEFKLFKLTFEINSSDVSFIFHDLEIEEVS